MLQGGASGGPAAAADGGGPMSPMSLDAIGPARPSRYESQKRRDWHTFGQYLRNHRPPLELPRCSGAHVLEFLRYLDQFGKTKVHAAGCPFFGHPSPPAPCPCPLRQAWGSLDALVGRLRAAFEEHGGRPEANPFGARAVRLYLREVRDSQAKARGIAYEKKRRKRPSAAQKAATKAPKAEPAPEKMNLAAPPPPPPAQEAPADQGHRFFVPHQYHHHHHHAQFMHHGGAHFLLAPLGGGGDASSVTASNNDSGGSGGNGGDEMAMAMAAAAEAHAAGCMLPLSVFN